MSSHREAGDQAHVHDEAEEPVLAQAEHGELAEADLERASGGLTTCVQKITDRPRADINDVYV